MHYYIVIAYLLQMRYRHARLFLILLSGAFVDCCILQLSSINHNTRSP